MQHCTIRALQRFEGEITFAHVACRCRDDGQLEAVVSGQIELPIECAAFAPRSQFEVLRIDGAAPAIVPQHIRLAQPWHGTVPTVPTVDELRTSGVFEEDVPAIIEHEVARAAAGMWPYGRRPPDAIEQFPALDAETAAMALCYAIERLPASEEATGLSGVASELRARLIEHLVGRAAPGGSDDAEPALRPREPGDPPPEPGTIADPEGYAVALASGAIREIPPDSPEAVAAPAAVEAPPPSDPPVDATQPLGHRAAREAGLRSLAELPDRGQSLRAIVHQHGLEGIGNAKSEMIAAILAHEFPEG